MQMHTQRRALWASVRRSYLVTVDRWILVPEQEARGVRIPDSIPRLGRSLHRSVIALCEKVPHPEDDDFQTGEPLRKFAIKLLVRPALRQAGVEVVPMGHRPDRELCVCGMGCGRRIRVRGAQFRAQPRQPGGPFRWMSPSDASASASATFRRSARRVLIVSWNETRDTYGDDWAHDEWQAGLEDGVVGAPEADMELRISVFLHVLHPRKYRRWQGAPMVCIRGPQQD